MKVVKIPISLPCLLDLIAGRMSAFSVKEIVAPGISLSQIPEDARCIDVVRPAEPGAPMLAYIQSEAFKQVPEGGVIPQASIWWDEK